MKNIAIFAILALLVLVVVGPPVVLESLSLGTQQVAHATNEGSYRYGYEQAKSQWQSCMTPDADCSGAHAVCSDGVWGVAYNSTLHERMQQFQGSISNQTACIDGFVHSWNHMCDIQAKGYDEVQCPTSADAGIAN